MLYIYIIYVYTFLLPNTKTVCWVVTALNLIVILVETHLYGKNKFTNHYRMRLPHHDLCLASQPNCGIPETASFPLPFIDKWIFRPEF